jgi:copper chaperone
MGPKTFVLNIEGMSCAHCVKAVKSGVEKLPGVKSVEVSLENKKATVTVDPTLVGLPAIKAAIEEEGYSVQ